MDTFYQVCRLRTVFVCESFVLNDVAAVEVLIFRIRMESFMSSFDNLDVSSNNDIYYLFHSANGELQSFMKADLQLTALHNSPIVYLQSFCFCIYTSVNNCFLSLKF